MKAQKTEIQKIVHLVPSFGCGGLEKVIVNLVNHSRDYPVKHVLISLTSEFGLIKAFDVPVDVYCIGKKPGNDLFSHYKLLRLLRRLKPKAMHTYNFGTIEYHLVAKLAGVPTTVHCDHGRGGDDPKGLNQFNNRFRKLISTFINHYTVVSYDLYNWVINDLGINNKKVSLVFNGVNVPAQMPIQDRTNNAKVITTVGRLDPIKNQTMLMKAFQLAKEKSNVMDTTILQFVGDGPSYQELDTFKSTLTHQSDIHMLGYRSDVDDILSGTDLFALSSHYEAMPMTILESMALGIPVVTTNVGGISKFITDNEVWFVEPNNAEQMSELFVQILSGSTDVQQKVERAYNLVSSKYSVESMVAQYMTLYKVLPNS
ncbi:glycosyltransferase [Psychrosphaera sp. B3R10]|uniref:glycosyltransferase n=1 Tax=unclassified Psychrosphaera TaxID=2641570 RepID=UPI001C09AA51|nr:MULTISPECIES: glycosyltransferase [unclassified Psychrosphaera]MBU2883731.1 glycosyltransferase [Psychrosphaera sp. I2R16]MBU2987967.1 glycosyltransferase [Psychrosphaera sp. B3R10]